MSPARKDYVETFALSAAFAAVSAIFLLPLGQRVSQLAAGLAMALAMASLALAALAVDRAAATWRSSAGGVGIDAAGLLAALAASNTPQADYRSLFISLTALATAARVSESYRPTEAR